MRGQQASRMLRQVWERCRPREVYQELKKYFFKSEGMDGDGKEQEGKVQE